MSHLVVIGSGIKALAHLSQETIVVIEQAAKVLYLVNEPLMKAWIERKAKLSQSLDEIYFAYERRIDAYQAITDYIIAENERFPSLCVIFYGHPAMFASSALRAVQQVKKNNKEADILPAISSLDCLFADLAIDPGENGCFSVDATDFLIYKKKFDVCSDLVLWQVGNLGTYNLEKTSCLQVLQDYLAGHYPIDHELCLYEASQYPTVKPRVDFFPLRKLSKQAISGTSTLYVPAIPSAHCDFEMLEKLGMQIKNFQVAPMLLGTKTN